MSFRGRTHDRKGLAFHAESRSRTAARSERLRLPRALHHVRPRLGHGAVVARSSRCIRSASRRWPSTWSVTASACASSTSPCSCSTSPTSTSRPTSRKLDPVAFGIDLHWLPHAHGSIEVARIVKKHHPETPVIFGGLSSTLLPRGAHHLRRRRLRGARRLDRGADDAPHEGAEGRRRLRRHPQPDVEGRLGRGRRQRRCPGCRAT